MNKLGTNWVFDLEFHLTLCIYVLYSFAWCFSTCNGDVSLFAHDNVMNEFVRKNKSQFITISNVILINL